MEWKRCSKCDNLKPIDNFNWASKKKGKRHSRCKECQAEDRIKNKEKIREYQKKWYQENREAKLEQSNKWKRENKERKRKTDREWYEANKERVAKYHKKWNEENAERIRKQKQQYYIENRERIIERTSKYNIDLAKNDANHRIKKNVSRAILTSLRDFGGKNGRRTEDIIGYPIAVLKDWIEQHWEPWMNWDNYGRASIEEKTWNIDHIIPMSLYNFFSEDDIKKCWHYRNLRPISAEENLKKQNKLDLNLVEEYNIEDLLPDYLVLDE